MTDRELMQVALHALEEITGWQSLAPGYVMEEADEAKNSLRERLEQPEPEPVKYAATKSPMIPDNMFSTNASVYTAPPKREWVGLTQQEINLIVDSNMTITDHLLRDAIEAIVVDIEVAIIEKNYG